MAKKQMKYNNVMKQCATQALIKLMLRFRTKWSRRILLWAIIRLPEEAVDIDILGQVSHELLYYNEKDQSNGKV